MPRNAQWTTQEDQELTRLTLRNSKENNGNLDWDEIHDLRRGQISRRSKNAMISRWWKIKETQDYDINDNNDDANDINDLNDDDDDDNHALITKENGIDDNNHSNDDNDEPHNSNNNTDNSNNNNDDDDDDDDDDDLIVNGNNEHVDNEQVDIDMDMDDDIDRNDTIAIRKKRKRRKKRKNSNSNTETVKNPLQNIIHSLLTKNEMNENEKYTFEESSDANENDEDEDIISYKNYYRHDIETLKLTSFNLTVLKPYIRAFEQQILINNKNDMDINQYISENKNLRKTIILQNKFLTELYTKIQHQQGIVREMVECDEKLKFKLKYINQQQNIFNREIISKNKQINKLQQLIINNQNENNKYINYTKEIVKILNILSERVVNNNLLNDLNDIISLIDNLLQIIQIQTPSQTLNINQLMTSLQLKLYLILNTTPYAKNIQDIESRKRKRPNCMDDNEDMTGNPMKKHKINNKQLSLPMINGKPPPPVFTSINNENNTNNMLAALPQTNNNINENNKNPPPLPPPPPPPTNGATQMTNTNNNNNNNQKDTYGIDLLLQVAMLENKQTPK